MSSLNSMTDTEISAKITQTKLEISAYDTAILEAIPTGGVKEFRQGTTHITKATLSELRSDRDSLLNQLSILGRSL